MAWNPEPKVADCRDIARKWNTDTIIIISVADGGRMEMATYGKTNVLCGFAKALGNTAFDAIERRLDGAAKQVDKKPTHAHGFGGMNSDSPIHPSNQAQVLPNND